jgi:hypothetical protein
MWTAPRRAEDNFQKDKQNPKKLPELSMNLLKYLSEGS